MTCVSTYTEQERAAEKPPLSPALPLPISQKVIPNATKWSEESVCN